MFQSTPPYPRTLAEFAWIALAVFVTYFFKHLPALFRRQTPAESNKTQAEARQINVHSQIEEGTMMIELIKVSAQAALDADRLRKEKEFQQARADGLQEKLRIAESARDLAEQELDRHIRIGKQT